MSQVYPHQSVDPSPPCPQQFTVWKKCLFFNDVGFTVYDCSGNLLFRVENYTPSVKSHLLLMDASGNSLLTLRRKVPSLHRRWEGFTCNNETVGLGNGNGSAKERVFAMKRSSIISPKTSVDVFVASSSFRVSYLSRRQPDYHIEGSFRERCCRIYSRTRSLVAEVERKRASCDMMLEKNVFSLTVYPGFDPALILSWIVVLDCINREDLRVLKRVALHFRSRSYRLLKNVSMRRKEGFSSSEAKGKGDFTEIKC